MTIDPRRADLSALTERNVGLRLLAERQREALDVLALLVRSEYGDKMTLAQIAATWTTATDDQVEALREYEPAVLADEGPA